MTNLRHILIELQESLLDPKSYDYNIEELETIQEFKSSSGAEIGVHYPKSGNFGLYFAFSPENSSTQEQREQLLEQFLQISNEFIKPLIELTSLFFFELTNNDETACSFETLIIEHHINTNHLDTSSEAVWEITTEITDHII